MMGYYEYGTRDQLNNTLKGTYKNHTGLDSDIGIFRPLYYGSVFDHPYLLEFLLPFGGLNNGRVNGARLGDATGVGDPIVSATFWPLSQNEQKTWVSVSEWVSLPIGTYDRNRPLNLGNNRWQNDLQVDLTKGLGQKFTVDFAGDWITYGDNGNAGTGHQTLRENSSYNFYTWVSYDVTDAVHRLMPSWGTGSISVGYAGTWGGVQKLNGIETGSKTEENQIRFTYEQFISPTWQALISFNHDLNVTGQFRQDFGMVFRLTKVF
jgi:hypothetical protein